MILILSIVEFLIEDKDSNYIFIKVIIFDSCYPKEKQTSANELLCLCNMKGMNIMMQKMSFGKYQGKSVAYVVLKDFEYFIWMYQNNMSNRPEYTEALRLLQILDAKPFYQKCYSCRQKAAAKFSLYHGGVAVPSFFCEECDPYSQGAIRGKLAIYSSLRDVVNCGIPYKNYINTVIACVAEAKGFPKRKTEKALEDFFGI
ncbi:MAG: hypothetical protein K2N87_11985 [Eubacterium sp.]|nr:hypothetical protein [Eubacterium sp.]